jgi:hypothetical protein
MGEQGVLDRFGHRAPGYGAGHVDSGRSSAAYAYSGSPGRLTTMGKTKGPSSSSPVAREDRPPWGRGRGLLIANSRRWGEPSWRNPNRGAYQSKKEDPSDLVASGGGGLTW